jgi:enoyl-CoA hydratase
VINLRSSADTVIVEIATGPLNMLDLESVTRIGEALAESASASLIVLTSTSRAFSAGFDLDRILKEPPTYTAQLLEAFEGVVQALVSTAVPVIAALPGHAIGAGYLLAAACDYRLMAKGRIGVPESRVGFPVPPGSLEVLRAVAGESTRTLVYGGELWDGDRALAAHLVDEMSTEDGLINRAIEVGAAWIAPSSEAFRLHKSLMNQPLLMRMADARNRSQDAVAGYWTSAAARASASAYLDSLRTR